MLRRTKLWALVVLLVTVGTGRGVAGAAVVDSQVEGLEAARARYAGLVKRGAELDVPALKKLPEPGERHPDVLWLRARLGAEGYGGDVADEPEKRDRFDGSLRTAVGHYQYAHGIEATGRLDQNTVEALRVPLRRRLEQIERALAARRAGAERVERDFLEVNVPAYQARLVLDGATVRSFRVVVGRAKLVRDPVTGRRGPWNRTPLLDGRIDRVVFNPVWRVPERIRVGELMPREAKEPGYLERNGFLVRGDSVVQLPGPGNALGRVKFLFENEHGVYLHDTPLKHLFRRSRRALSHGCVRVESADELARLLISRESDERGLDVNDLWATGRETEIVLERPLPLYIEYVTVVVGPHGYVHFLEDVYGRER